MKRRSLQVIVAMSVLIVVVFFSAKAVAQTDAQDMCCSNAYIYANVMVKQIRDACSEAPVPKSEERVNQIIWEAVKGYADEVDVQKAAGRILAARSCHGNRPLPVHTDNRGVGVVETKVDPRLCFASSVLIPLYAEQVSIALEKCGATKVVIPFPMKMTVTVPASSPTCVCCQKEQCTGKSGNDDPPKPPPTDTPKDDGGGGGSKQEDLGGIDPPKDTKADPPVPPQVPTEPVLSVGLTNAVRPSDTRMSSLQMPVVMDDGSSYASVGGRIKPYALSLQDDMLKANLDEKVVKVDSGWNFLRALWLSFGASQGPKWNREGTETNKAFALGVDILNQLDPFLNSDLSACLEKAMAEAGVKHPRDLDAAQQMFLAAKDDCFAEAKIATSINFASADGVILRPSYAFEYFPWQGWSFTAYTNTYFVEKQKKSDNYYVPVELGTQVSYGVSIFSVFADGSGTVAFGDRPEFNDKLDHVRFSGGVGGSLALFSGMTATFGVRYMPSAWEDGGADSEVKLISSIGWAGKDASSEYVNHRWSNELRVLRAREEERQQKLAEAKRRKDEEERKRREMKKQQKGEQSVAQ